MSDTLKSPEFLKLTSQAQKAFEKASHIHDIDHLEGIFCVQDMLDILGKEMDIQNLLIQNKKS